jgi:hypothetical protein
VLGLTLAAALVATSAGAQTIKEGYEFKKPKAVIASDDLDVGVSGASSPVTQQGKVVLGFEGISQYDVASVGRNFIPPDTMGAVGKTQYMEFVNGGVAVFDKATGARTSFQSDLAFWGGAGQVGANGDSRVMYNADADRWIALSFGGNAKDIQIGVSTTSDALGPWQSTKFEGYAGLGFGATADYPTLALDNNAVYIGTNNFAPSSAGGVNSFRGTTLDVIPLGSLFSAGAPTTTGLVKFETPYNSSSSSNDFTRGYAIQGVNSSDASSTGNIVAVSLNDFAISRYDVLNAGTAGATRTASVDVGGTYDFNSPGRQPSALNPRVIDTGDDRIGSSVWEVNGRIYTLHTVTEVGTDYTVIRYDVIDAATNAVLDEGNIGAAGYDFYYGSLAVNKFGVVVMGYNRSGSSAVDGKISFLTRTFSTDASGHLIQLGDELLLKESVSGDYHNGSIDGQVAAGRQRWGDYSAVSLDPEDASVFWAIGQFAREPNNAANGHPGGTGGTRWGTWIAAIDIGGATGAPEPGTWALMLLGMGLAGAGLRRSRKSACRVSSGLV